MLNDPFHEEHSHEDRFEVPLEDLVEAEAEFIQDDFAEDAIPEDRDSVGEDRLDWDSILDNVDVEVREGAKEDVIDSETVDAKVAEDKLDDSVETDLVEKVDGVKTEDLPPVELGDLTIERRDELPGYLTGSEDAYDNQVTLYDNNYDQVLEDAKKQDEVSKRYQSPRVSRAWHRTKVSHGPRRYGSPVQRQETVMRKGYLRGPKTYR